MSSSDTPKESLSSKLFGWIVGIVVVGAVVIGLWWLVTTPDGRRFMDDAVRATSDFLSGKGLSLIHI